MHALKEKTTVKGKGKGKRSALTIDQRRSFESHIIEEGDDDDGFRLRHLNFKIKKVSVGAPLEALNLI